jgi:hypothetical protein
MKNVDKRWSLLLALPIALIMLFSASSCIGPRPEQQTIALQFEGGAIIPTAQKFIRCVPGGQRGDWDSGGHTYTYPGDQRVVDFTESRGNDRGPVHVLSKDGVELAVPGQLQYYLNTECAEGEKSPIVQFHLNLGRRYDASFNDGPNKVPDGWREVQRLYIETPLETAMDRAAQNYVWRDLVFNPQVKARWERDVLDALPGLIQRTTPTEIEFYNRLQPLIGVPTLVGAAGQQAQQAIVDGQRRVAEAQAREAEARANKLAADAQIAVERAKAEAKRQEIAGYGGIDHYNRHECIKAGCNPYQPTYVIGGTAPQPQPSP